MADFVKTLAFKNNNPFNIRYNSSNHWIGLEGNNRGFCKFESLRYGVRAGFVLLRTYIKNGYNTPSKIVNRFAPASENNVVNYLSFCCESSNLQPDEVIIDSFSLFKLGVSMMEIECNYHPSSSMLSYIIDLIKYYFVKDLIINYDYEK